MQIIETRNPYDFNLNFNLLPAEAVNNFLNYTTVDI